MNELVPVTQIKNENYVYFYKIGSYYEMKPQVFIKSELGYAMSCAFNIIRARSTSPHLVLDFLIKNPWPEFVAPKLVELETVQYYNRQRAKEIIRQGIKWTDKAFQEFIIGKGAKNRGKQTTSHNWNEILRVRERYSDLKNMKMYRLSYTPAFVSFLEQTMDKDKQIPDRYKWKSAVELLKNLQAKDGQDFKEYIDDWAKRLMTEVWDGKKTIG